MIATSAGLRRRSIRGAGDPVTSAVARALALRARCSYLSARIEAAPDDDALPAPSDVEELLGAAREYRSAAADAAFENPRTAAGAAAQIELAASIVVDLLKRDMDGSGPCEHELEVAFASGALSSAWSWANAVAVASLASRCPASAAVEEPAEGDDWRLTELFRAWQIAIARANSSSGSDDATIEAASGVIAAIERQIAREPVKGLKGLAIKTFLSLYYDGFDGGANERLQPREERTDISISVIADIARLAPELAPFCSPPPPNR